MANIIMCKIYTDVGGIRYMLTNNIRQMNHSIPISYFSRNPKHLNLLFTCLTK